MAATTSQTEFIGLKLAIDQAPVYAIVKVPYYEVILTLL